MAVKISAPCANPTGLELLLRAAANIGQSHSHAHQPNEEDQPEESQASDPFALGDAAGEGMQKNGERVGLTQGKHVGIDGEIISQRKQDDPDDHRVDRHFAPLAARLSLAPGRCQSS